MEEINTTLEDLTGRDEDVSQHVINGIKYRFKRNEHGAKVCQVNSDEHRRWLLHSGNFRLYLPPESEAEPFDEEAFIAEWEGLTAKQFCGYFRKVKGSDGKESEDKQYVKGYVHQHLDEFAACSQKTRLKAIDKWNQATIKTDENVVDPDLDGLRWPG